MGFISALLLVGSADAANLTVNSGADSGGSCPGAKCTLRQAIIAAAPRDTITFATDLTTITLTSGELVINKWLTIIGPGPDLLTVQRSTAEGTPNFHIFHVSVDFELVNISGLTIHNGSSSSSDNGGAIFNGSLSFLTISDCTISGSLSSGILGGGAIFNNGGDPGGNLTITNSTISGNSTLGDFGGGGIHDGGGTVTITNSTISSNSAGGNASGGGIFTNGRTTITNSTISGNSAGGTGGGINFRGILNLTNSTVSGNSANDGGGFRSNLNRQVNLKNTIIAKNIAVTGPDGSGAVNSMGYNLIGNNVGVTITPASSDQIGTAAVPIDPLLGLLQANGGPTFTQALQSDSPAVNRGNPNGSGRDQRGYVRAGVSDIGAFEFGGTVPVLLGNISTRLGVETGNNVLIGGFIITGTEPKKIIVRAIGPSLPLDGVLADPILELRNSSGDLISSNDNWRSDHESQIIATGIPPSHELESAIVATLPAYNSAYTAIVSGVSNGTGIGVVEAYDLDEIVDSKLANISTRGLVQTGNNVLIAGTIVLGPATQRVLVRAIGPSLPVDGKLENPTLELRDGNGGLIRANDDWRSDQETEIVATTIPPTNDLESALIETLPANGTAYTAIVSGAGSTTGVAVVEVYGLN